MSRPLKAEVDHRVAEAAHRAEVPEPAPPSEAGDEAGGGSCRVMCG